MAALAAVARGACAPKFQRRREPVETDGQILKEPIDSRL